MSAVHDVEPRGYVPTDNERRAAFYGPDSNDPCPRERSAEFNQFEAVRFAATYPEHIWETLMLSDLIPAEVYALMIEDADKAGGLEFASLSDLMEQEFAPLDWVVPGIIPEGTTLLVAPPKVGKSWLALDVALAASTGTKAFGSVEVGKARPVLYIDLESGPRRLQSRVQAQGWTAPFGAFSFHLERGSAWEAIDTFMTLNKGKRPLIVVDTLAGVMGDKPKDRTQYQHDYETLSRLQTVSRADAGAAVIVVHHTRKATSDDPMLAIGGTNGITGAVDTPVILNRPDRHSTDGELNVMARDFEGGEFALSFQGARWVLVGGDTDAAQNARAEREEARARNKLTPVAQGILQVIESDTERLWTPADVIENYSGAANADTIRQNLRRLADRDLIAQEGRGMYRAK